MESWEWLGEDKVVQVRFGCDGAKKWCYHSAVLTYSSFWSKVEQVYLYSNIAFWKCRHFAWRKLLCWYLFIVETLISTLSIFSIFSTDICQSVSVKVRAKDCSWKRDQKLCRKRFTDPGKVSSPLYGEAVTTDSSGYGVTSWDLNVLNGDGPLTAQRARDNDLYIFGTRGYILVLLESC